MTWGYSRWSSKRLNFDAALAILKTAKKIENGKPYGSWNRLMPGEVKDDEIVSVTYIQGNMARKNSYRNFRTDLCTWHKDGTIEVFGNNLSNISKERLEHVLGLCFYREKIPAFNQRAVVPSVVATVRVPDNEQAFHVCNFIIKPDGQVDTNLLPSKDYIVVIDTKPGRELYKQAKPIIHRAKVIERLTDTARKPRWKGGPVHVLPDAGAKFLSKQYGKPIEEVELKAGVLSIDMEKGVAKAARLAIQATPGATWTISLLHPPVHGIKL